MNSKTVPNYLAQAILVTLCCCIPFGIIAMVYATQVNFRLQIGDYGGAIKASKEAKKWCWWSFSIGGVFTLFYIILLLLPFL